MHILTTATGYEIGKLDVFIRSFERMTKSSLLTIFVDKANYPAYRAVESDRLKIVEVDQRIFKKQRVLDILQDHLSRAFGVRSLDDPRFYPACCARYFYYHDFIGNLSVDDTRSEEIAIIDSRDVFFQGDPELESLDANIIFALEDKVIRDQPANYGWLKRIYGVEVADSLGGHIVSCAGTTYGKRAAVLEYLNKMVEELVANRKVICLRPALDQGVHNKVLYSNEFRGSLFSGPVDSNLATVGIIDDLSYRVEGQEIVFNDGVAPRMIHQFDRFPGLERDLRRILAM